MNKEYEEIIVRSFFEKRIQNRIIFELLSTKKRKDALSRLCHNYKDVLCEKYMMELPKPNSNHIDIEGLLKKYGANDNCYVISWHNEIDGQCLPLIDALEQVVGLGMPSLVFCVPDRLLYFEGEQCQSTPPRYILKRDE